MRMSHILLVVLVLLLICFGCSRQSSDGAGDLSVKNIEFEDVNSNEVIISFDINNNLEASQECYVSLVMSQGGKVFQDDKIYLGKVEEKAHKRVVVDMMNGKTEVNITPTCIPFPANYDKDSALLYEGLISGLNVSCENITDIRTGLACGFIEDSDNRLTYARECFNGRETAGSFFCLAFLSGDASICNSIETEDPLFFKCQAFVRANSEYCGLAEDSLNSDFCYMEMAVSTGEKMLCSKIKDAEKKEECVEADPGDYYRE